MKLLISVAVLVWQLRSIACDPGLIDLKDLPDFRKPRERPAISTKLPSLNAITDVVKTTTMPSTTSNWDGYHSVKLTHEDVVTGSNSVYGSQQQMQQIPNGGGIIFAISPGQDGQGSSSQPLMSAAPPQPVLMQYLSPEGTPRQASVQYIQLLRPIMMVPAQPYMPAKPINEPPVQTTTVAATTYKPASGSSYNHQLMMLNPYGPYLRQPQAAPYSSPIIPSYYQTNPRQMESQKSAFELGLNMNEYVPSASSHHSTAVLAPRSGMSSMSPYSYRSNQFQARAQRA